VSRVNKKCQAQKSLAWDLEIAEYRQKLAALIKPHVKDLEFVDLPAVLWIHQSDQTTVNESIFDLPVFKPENRELWHGDRLFEPGGHAINQAGLETDDMLRPLGADGQPALESLFAAGIILAHQD